LKRKYKGLGVCGVLLCMTFSKFIRVNYGINGQMAVMIGSLLIMLIGILYLMLTKNGFVALGALCFAMPLVVGAVGIYLDNLYVMASGLALFFIVGVIVIKVGGKYIENRK
jgi:uncharacterized membrane protein YGL010W